MSIESRQEVDVEEVQRTLSEALGSRFKVSVVSDSTLKVGRTGVIPSKVELSRVHGMTTFTVHTTGLIVSRVVQAVSVNPRVRRALKQAYSET